MARLGSRTGQPSSTSPPTAFEHSISSHDSVVCRVRLSPVTSRNQHSTWIRAAYLPMQEYLNVRLTVNEFTPDVLFPQETRSSSCVFPLAVFPIYHRLNITKDVDPIDPEYFCHRKVSAPGYLQPYMAEFGSKYCTGDNEQCHSTCVRGPPKPVRAQF